MLVTVTECIQNWSKNQFWAFASAVPFYKYLSQKVSPQYFPAKVSGCLTYFSSFQIISETERWNWLNCQQHFGLSRFPIFKEFSAPLKTSYWKLHLAAEYLMWRPPVQDLSLWVSYVFEKRIIIMSLNCLCYDKKKWSLQTFVGLSVYFGYFVYKKRTTKNQNEIVLYFIYYRTFQYSDMSLIYLFTNIFIHFVQVWKSGFCIE